MHHTYHLIDSHLLPAEGMTDIKGWKEGETIHTSPFTMNELRDHPEKRNMLITIFPFFSLVLGELTISLLSKEQTSR